MDTRMPDSTVQTPEEAELARLMVDTLNLEMNVDDIDPLSPLFGDGLGLDSIDVLELALAISKTYGVQLRADDADNGTIFQSLRNLNAHIRRRRPA